MSSVASIYGPSDIDAVDWPQTLHGAQAKRFLPWMVKEGPQAFIDNAPVRMLAVRVDDEVMPLVLADGAAGCTNVCSPTAHFVDYAREELAKEGVAGSGRFVRGLLPALGWTLRAFRAERIVYVNHWLWTTNPAPALTAGQVADLTAFLAREFPGRAIVFRSLNEPLYGLLLAALRDALWRPVASRKVYLVDGARPDALDHRDARRDLGLLDRMDMRLVSHGLVDADFDRMIALYRGLYVGKYPRMNIQFKADYLRRAADSGLLTFHAFRREGRIDAFWADFERDGIMTPPMIGYDLDAPREVGLYRMTIAAMLREAARRRARMNLSAGAGEFKRNRGGMPVVEFDMVYDRHLAPHRRFPWWVLRHSYTAKRMEALGD